MFPFRKPVIKVFATGGSEEIAEDICRGLRKRIPKEFQPSGGINLGKITADSFSNDNIQVTIGDSVRGEFVIVVHSQVSPVNDHLIELFLLLDALKRAKVEDIMILFPYLPLSRSDKKNKPHISVGASFLGKVIGGYFGIEHVLCLDLHDPHIKHYFDGFDADDVTALYLIVDFVKKQVVSDGKDWAVVFADAGSAKRYEEVGHLLGLPSAYIDKKRPKDDDNVNVSKVVGNVNGKHCLLIDDEILTGGTIIKGANYLFNEGAVSVSVAATHAVMRSKNHRDNWVAKRLENSRIDRFIITNSIPIGKKLEGTSKFIVLQVGNLMAEGTKRLIMSESLTEMRGLDRVVLYDG